MPSPSEDQAAFARALFSGARPGFVTAHATDEVDRRFDVYRNNVALSLSRALAARFPATVRLVGEDYFTPLSRAFTVAHPPANPILLAWGAAFPAFLAGRTELSAYPWLPDVARLEWLRGLAYHAPDAAPAPTETLGRAAAAADQTRLVLHPSLALLPSRFPVVAVWEGQQPGARPEPLPSGGQTAMVLRDRALNVQVTALGSGDAAFVAACLAGQPLLAAAQAGASAAQAHDPTPILMHLARAGAIIDAKDQNDAD
jgi:hypothetical protein